VARHLRPWVVLEARGVVEVQVRAHRALIIRDAPRRSDAGRPSIAPIRSGASPWSAPVPHPPAGRRGRPGAATGAPAPSPAPVAALRRSAPCARCSGCARSTSSCADTSPAASIRACCAGPANASSAAGPCSVGESRPKAGVCSKSGPPEASVMKGTMTRVPRVSPRAAGGSGLDPAQAPGERRREERYS